MNAQIIDYNYADVRQVRRPTTARERLIRETPPLGFSLRFCRVLSAGALGWLAGLFYICIIQIILIKINKTAAGSRSLLKTCCGNHCCTCVFI